MAGERTQRRLAAILAADVVGYSRLIGADEEGTLAALKAHWRELTDPKVEQHHGRVVKTTGDGALIEFASVVDAVRFAVDIQRGMAERNVGVPPDKRIEFRIGINVGDIVIDGDDILGDGVNIAARLEGLAEPGGVLVSRAVRDQVRDRLELAFEDLGERQFKNIARPVRVYRVRLDEVATRRSAAVKRSRRLAVDFGAGAVVVLVAGAALWNFYPREPSAPSPSVAPQPTIIAAAPSIAVLPFVNMSGDPALELFCRWRHRHDDRRPVALPGNSRRRPHFHCRLQGQSHRCPTDQQGVGGSLRARRERSEGHRRNSGLWRS